MDPDILKKEVMAHHKAVGAVTEANPVIPKGDFESIIAEIDHMIASVPDSEIVGAYNAFSAVMPQKFTILNVHSERGRREEGLFDAHGV